MTFPTSTVLRPAIRTSVHKLYVYIMSQRRTYESGNIPELQCIPSLFRYMIGRITDHPSQHETRATHILSEWPYNY